MSFNFIAGSYHIIIDMYKGQIVGFYIPFTSYGHAETLSIFANCGSRTYTDVTDCGLDAEVAKEVMFLGTFICVSVFTIAPKLMNSSL